MIVATSITISLIVGFLLGLCWAGYCMGWRSERCRRAIWETKKSEEIPRLVPQFQHAIAIAAQTWCDARTINTPMNAALAQVFAEKIGEYIAALQWCGGASDFQHGGDGVPEGKAAVGFDKICRPLMKCRTKAIDISKLSREAYKRLRDTCPEVVGLGSKDV